MSAEGPTSRAPEALEATEAAKELPPFSLSGPLPRGVTVLEASAGTGKTYTIGALAARFVAAGTPLSALLLVTFTRMATGELRERVRERLVSAERGLARLGVPHDPPGLSGGSQAEPDEVITALADGDAEAVKLRRDRLAAAISNFDAATIATTHSFCQEVLAELGTLGDLEPESHLVEDLDELTEEVIDDLYVRAFVTDPRPPFDRAEAGRIGRFAIAHPTATIHPAHGADGTVAARRARLAAAARDELESRKRALAVMSYDDLLVRLRGVLLGPHGDRAVARLRSRYRAVLIDEFQDTDPVQWEIVHRAFVAQDVALVLVADPKQAIYAFRGADVHAYLTAAASAGAQATLATNRRSDQRLIDALDALFGAARLGHPGIVYRTVRATAAHQQPRLRGAPCDAALRIRVVDRSQPLVELTQRGFASAPSAREYVARDLADDIVALLRSDATIRTGGRAPRGAAGVTAGQAASDGDVAVLPGDIAVLVRSHRQARLIHRELEAAGIPAVLGGAGSVLATSAAVDWLTLLAALERPASPPRARAAALTPFLGWSAERVARASEEQLEALHQQLHGWARLLRLRGVAALGEAITQGERLPARLLRERGGERRLTDLDHVGEVLHAVATAERLGTAALTAWLRQRIAAPDRDGEADELTRRLESDADAVQVLTIHRSKGLEFPIVYCPFLWDPPWSPSDARPVFFHDQQTGERAIDVGLEGAGYVAHRELAEDEERGEELRLGYVALTRARHQTVVWWVGSYSSPDSSLSRIAFARAEDGEIPRRAGAVPTDAEAIARLGTIASRAPGAISVEWSRLGRKPSSWSERPQPQAELSTASFDRRLDARWRRTSYSDITAAAHEAWLAGEPDAWVASEPEEPLRLDEPPEPLPAPVLTPRVDRDGGSTEELKEVALTLAAMPSGARVGSFVHRLFEAIEFDAPDLNAELRAHAAELAARSGVDTGDMEALVAGLADAIRTPLGPRDGSLRLRDVGRSDRLDELEFELPLAGGDRVTGTVTLRGIAALLRERLAPAEPVAAYAARLEDPLLRRELRGYLTGSIDLVVRLGGSGGARYALIDYKTNRLAGAQEQLRAWHYRPAALAAEMSRSHYVLQALLYCAALHRYLRWRIPGYDPQRDPAVVHYLFLRGMQGARTPVLDGQRLGVFSWQPPGALVAALSDLLDGVPEAQA
jgi:exodeoxyribonuclease V beta subunit